LEHKILKHLLKEKLSCTYWRSIQLSNGIFKQQICHIHF